MRFAAGRPLWHLSLCHRTPTGPLPVLRWSPTKTRQAEALRDLILINLGTSEALIPEHSRLIMTWRKPLSLEEINQLAQTPEVRVRPGRP